MGRGAALQGLRGRLPPESQWRSALLARRSSRRETGKATDRGRGGIVRQRRRYCLRVELSLGMAGIQVAESAFRNSRLSWEHAVVGIELDRFGAPHCFGDECASEVAGKLRAYGPLEEEPDMSAVSRS